jgi:hypothetical protein
MSWIKNKLVKVTAYSFILSMLAIFIAVISIFAIEIYGNSQLGKIDKQTPLHETNYYGERLKEDPYRKFTIQHLHPYYFFSLPWTETDRQKANNSYVNVDEHGFRKNSFNGGKQIVLLGGSTAFGHYSSSDDETIAANLSKRLGVKVVNRNAPSWNSHQESVALLKFQESYLASISFSTSNDISIYCGDKLFESSYKDQMESFTKIASYFNDIRGVPLRGFFDELKAGLVVRLPHSYAIYRRYLKRERPPQVAGENTVFCNGHKGAQEVAKVILDNQRRMEILSRGRNAKHLLVIQPWYPLHTSATSKHKQKFYDEINFRNEVISLVMRDDFCKTSCVDFSKLFDESGDNKPVHSGVLLYDGSEGSLNSALFVDNVHLTDKGVKLVVARLRGTLGRFFELY